MTAMDEMRGAAKLALDLYREGDVPGAAAAGVELAKLVLEESTRLERSPAKAFTFEMPEDDAN